MPLSLKLIMGTPCDSRVAHVRNLDLESVESTIYFAFQNFLCGSFQKPLISLLSKL